MSKSYKSVATTTADHPPLRSQPRTMTWWPKAAPILIVVPAALSIALLPINKNTYSGQLLTWSINNRGAVQVVIQVLSSILSFLWLYSIRTVISQWTRYRLSGFPVKLNTLRLWSAISLATTNWDLPWVKALVALGFFALTLLPATLWAGALTPWLTEQLQDVRILMPGAVYDASLIGDCQTRQQTNGTFTNCPLYSNNADLLSTIASATSTSEAERHHSKWDYSRYSYIGRSFGVGGSVGLTDQDIVAMRTPTWYNYTEKGFITRTKCIYNDSAAYIIEQKSPSTGGNGYPDMFMAKGLLPNSNWTEPLKYMYYAQIAWENKDKVVGLFNGGPRKPENDNGYYFGIAAGTYYRQLNNIQCELDFEPTHFTVHVSMQNNTINVTSRPEPVAKVLDPDHYLRRQAIGSIGLSFIVTSLYTNTVGDAFWRNVRNMHTRRSPLAPVDSFSNETILEAVADSVSAMMDDALVALNSYLLTSLDTTQPVETLVAMPAVRIGTRKFIIAGMVVNVAGLVFVFVACLYLARVKVPLFDYNDLGCIALSATRDATGDEAADAWDGDPKSQSLDSLLAKLEVDSTGRPVVMLQDKGGVAEK